MKASQFALAVRVQIGNPGELPRAVGVAGDFYAFHVVNVPNDEHLVFCGGIHHALCVGGGKLASCDRFNHGGFLSPAEGPLPVGLLFFGEAPPPDEGFLVLLLAEGGACG